MDDRSHMVHPLSNLIATEQVRGGDLIRVDFDSSLDRLTFFKKGSHGQKLHVKGLAENRVRSFVCI